MSGVSETQRHGLTAYWGLAVLFLANVFNQGDRMLFGVVADPIRKDLALSDTQLALASGLFFILFNLIGGLFIARVIDRGNRVRILACGVVVWSIATATTGLAHNYVTLSLSRVLVGIGEATVFPAAMSLIPDLFRPAARGRAVSIFQSSNFVGIVGGTIIAGILAASHGWRDMFVICGLAGLIVALLLFVTVSEPAREASADDRDRQAYWADFRAGMGRVVSMPGIVPLALALGFALMMGTVMGAWGPAFLLRVHQVPLAEVGLAIGPPVGLGGIVGTLASGFIVDALIRRSGDNRSALLVPIWAVPLALPFMAGFVFLPYLGATLACAAVMNILLSAAVPPVMHFAINAAKPADRGLATTFILMVMGLIGGALGPFIVGAASDLLAPSMGDLALRYAIGVILVTPPIATLLLLQARRSIGAGRSPAGDGR